MTGDSRGHHTGAAGILSGAPYLAQDPGNASFSSTFSQPSIDQVIARALPQQTRFRSLEIGIAGDVTTSEGTTLQYLSHNGPNSFNLPEYSINQFFNRIFSGGLPTNSASTNSSGQGSPDEQIQKLIVDTVIDDAKDLQKKLGKTDQDRLNEHLQNLYELQRQLQAPMMPGIAGGSCSIPPQPMSIDDMAQKSGNMARLMALALACQQMQVSSIMFSGAVGNTVYPATGSGSSYHQLTHDNPEPQNQVRAGTVFIMRQFGKFLTELNAIKEGSTTLLDNCVILATSDVSKGFNHGVTNYPIILAGFAGGKIRNGIHSRSEGQNASQLLLTLIKSMGINRNEFGSGGAYTAQSLTAIEI